MRAKKAPASMSLERANKCLLYIKGVMYIRQDDVLKAFPKIIDYGGGP